MGATQFRLLCALGLREHHRLLDFGCGSLRAGRLLIPYLRKGHYYGIEPNAWLLDDAIKNEIGSLAEIKAPNFRNDSDFRADRFAVQFDYIIAQSVLNHAGRDLIATGLSSFKASLAERGLILATFRLREDKSSEFTGTGWVYPSSVAYRFATILEFIESAGLVGRAIPWFHPRLTWMALAHSRELLPQERDDIHLSGVGLRDPECARER
jgi:cyclopropane fatty-acyl-phospholipid synthase-like methyltransferase